MKPGSSAETADSDAGIVFAAANPSLQSDAEATSGAQGDAAGQTGTPEHGPASPSVVGKRMSLTRRQLAAGGGVLLCIAIVCVLIAIIPSPGNQQSEPDTGNAGSDRLSQDGDEVRGQRQPEPPEFQTGLVRVYTEEPGFHVLVDGNVVRGEDGQSVVTPCAVTAEAGLHTIKVYREGFLDTSQEVVLTADGEVTFTPIADPDGINSDALNAPWRDVDVGTPIPLAAVNSSRPEFDPYVTSDGLSLWFVGDRADGRGIFVATRLTPFHDFEEPRQISRSADLPGTPSATDDALLVVYAVPEKARLFALTRDNPLGDFDKEAIRAADGLSPTWASAQILGNGLRIYWLEIRSHKTRTLMWTRKLRDVPFAERDLYEFNMPGRHPCLSQDGLRQYVFDGHRVMRHRRSQVTQAFGAPAVIGELELPGYVPGETHRQYFVSHDEQWMFYCDDPDSGGDLFAVRLAAAPQWGVPPTGKAISPKPVEVAAVETDPDMLPAVIPEKPIEKPVDPRSLPLPYTAHRKVFKTLLAERRYGELTALIQNAESSSTMKPFVEQIGWDREELELIQQFWSDVRRGVLEVKAGDMIRIANNRVSFVEFKDDTIYGTRAGSPVRRKLDELRASELTQFYDRLESSGDAAGDLRAGVFLSHDRDGVPRSAQTRLERAGTAGDRFQERLVRRLIVQAKGELERSKFGEGVRFLQTATPLAEGLPVAGEIVQLQNSLYGYIKWRQVGPRGWAVRGNSYEATLERKRGAYLLTEMEYENVEVSLEWKTMDSMVAMGGVYFRYPGQGDPNENAYKIQLANDFGIAPDNFSTGALFKEDTADLNAVKPAGEWNTLHLRVHGPDVVVTINGKKVLESVAVSPDRAGKGYVALDGVAGGITYRRILVSELPK